MKTFFVHLYYTKKMFDILYFCEKCYLNAKLVKYDMHVSLTELSHARITTWLKFKKK